MRLSRGPYGKVRARASACGLMMATRPGNLPWAARAPRRGLRPIVFRLAMKSSTTVISTSTCVQLDDFGHGVALHDPLADFGVLGRDPAVERGIHRVAVELFFEALHFGLLGVDAGRACSVFICRAPPVSMRRAAWCSRTLAAACAASDESSSNSSLATGRARASLSGPAWPGEKSELASAQ